MKKRNVRLIFGLMALVCVCVTSCDNPIIKPWWGEKEPAETDFDYVAIIKDVPLLIYETIVEEKIVYEKIIEKVYETVYVDREVILPPEVLLQHITVVNIEFVMFAGESIVFNGDPGRIDPDGAPVIGATPLTNAEKQTNEAVVSGMVNLLNEHDDYFLILHGHANPTDGSSEETSILSYISLERARSVAHEVNEECGQTDGYLESQGRMTTRGYGGGRNMTGSGSSYAGLNRRVEAILITIETVPPDTTGTR